MTLTFCDEASRKRTRTTSAGLVIRGMIYVFRPEEAERRPLRLPATRRTACATRRLSDAIRGEDVRKDGEIQRDVSDGDVVVLVVGPPRRRTHHKLDHPQSSACTTRQRTGAHAAGGARAMRRTAEGNEVRGLPPPREGSLEEVRGLPPNQTLRSDRGTGHSRRATEATHEVVRSRGCDNGG